METITRDLQKTQDATDLSVQELTKKYNELFEKLIMSICKEINWKEFEKRGNVNIGYKIEYDPAGHVQYAIFWKEYPNNIDTRICAYIIPNLFLCSVSIFIEPPTNYSSYVRAICRTYLSVEDFIRYEEYKKIPIYLIGGK